MTTWLADKSALTRIGEGTDSEIWLPRIERGLIRITATTRLELGYSARNGEDFNEIFRSPPVTLMPIEYSSPEIEDRALEVLGLLADRGHHSAPAIPDLILAATAELNRLTILHVDKDFDLIAQVTGQPVERLKMPG